LLRPGSHWFHTQAYNANFGVKVPTRAGNLVKILSISNIKISQYSEGGDGDRDKNMEKKKSVQRQK